MRRLFLVVLVFMFTACTMGQRQGKRSNSEGSATNPPSAVASPMPPKAGSSGASRPTPIQITQSVPTNTSTPQQLNARRPLGIYAHMDLSNLANGRKKALNRNSTSGSDASLDSLYQGLLANPAISGLAVGVHWDQVNPNPPSSSQAYDWSDLDDVFNQVSMWNTKNPAQTPKTIQLIVSAGFDSPQWLLDQIPSCDGLFQSPPQTPAGNCGKASFADYFEPTDGSVLPLPWNPVYKSAFKTFLMALAARYEPKPELVSISIGGPTASSDEMILPRTGNTPNQAQFGGISPDVMWQKLLAFAYPGQPAYQNSDQAFIDEWDAAIDMYGQIFNGLTLVINPDVGAFPDFGKNYPAPPQTDTLYYKGDCPDADMSCAATTMILFHFMDPGVDRADAKSNQTGGMKAFSAKKDLGVNGVKLLSGMTANLGPASDILGGEQFDHPFSSDASDEGCPTNTCPANSISPEQAEYNVLRVFFDGTPDATDFGGTTGTTPLNYLQVSSEDIQYSTAHANDPAQIVQTNGTSVSMTAQDMLNLASQKLLQIAEGNHAP